MFPSNKNLEAKAARQSVSPRKVRSLAQLCKMPRDNFDVGDFWILTDTRTVTLTAQKAGESPTQQINIPRKTFDKLVDWYMREQSAVSSTERPPTENIEGRQS